MSYEKDKSVIPQDWFFPSYFAFVMWGPFAEPKNRLTLMETKDRPKLVRRGRRQKRIDLLEEKNDRRRSDESNERGYSTDQTLAAQNLSLIHI